jgi:hypothetical protein
VREQVANGCVRYVCKSVRRDGGGFLDERLVDGADDVIHDVPTAVRSVHAAAAAAYSWLRGAAARARRHRPLAAAFAAAGQELARAPPDPGRVRAGTAFDSPVRACMYPSMTCREQRASARALCRDDPYWLRSVKGFECTGGFRRAATTGLADEDRWERMGHFLVSALLAGLLLLLVWFVLSRTVAAGSGVAAGAAGEGGGRSVRVTL